MPRGKDERLLLLRNETLDPASAMIPTVGQSRARSDKPLASNTNATPQVLTQERERDRKPCAWQGIDKIEMPEERCPER